MGKMLHCTYWFTLITVNKTCIYYYMFQKTTSAEGTLKEAESNATSSYLYCSKYWNIDTRRVATCTQSTQLPTRCHRTEQSKMLQSAIKPWLMTLVYLLQVKSIQGSMSRDPPNMIVYTSCRPLLRPWTLFIGDKFKKNKTSR